MINTVFNGKTLFLVFHECNQKTLFLKSFISGVFSLDIYIWQNSKIVD